MILACGWGCGDAPAAPGESIEKSFRDAQKDPKKDPTPTSRDLKKIDPVKPKGP